MSVVKISITLFSIFSVQYFAQDIDVSKQLANCKVKGSVTVYDYKNKKWFYSDKKDSEVATLPASTFKIINSLIALESGAVKDEKEVFTWNGNNKNFFGTPMKVWNQDTNMEDAYKNSTIWFYVEMAKRIGVANYKKYLSSSEYGNLDLRYNQDGDFWNYGNFAISPENQIKFLIRLYEGRLPFSEANMEIVKKIMISKSDDGRIMHDKTGWTRESGKNIGWHVGFLEMPDNVIFFSTRITNDVYPENPDFGKCRAKITQEAIAHILKR